jgi:hypothetical protein
VKYEICCVGVMSQVNKMLVWCYSECISTPGRLEKYVWPRWPARCGYTLRVTSHKHLIHLSTLHQQSKYYHSFQVVFLQDFVNFKTFLRAKKRLKTSKIMEQSRRR